MFAYLVHADCIAQELNLVHGLGPVLKLADLFAEVGPVESKKQLKLLGLGDVVKSAALLEELIEEELALEQGQLLRSTRHLLGRQWWDEEAWKAEKKCLPELVEQVESPLRINGLSEGIDARNRVHMVITHRRFDQTWVLNF